MKQEIKYNPFEIQISSRATARDPFQTPVILYYMFHSVTRTGTVTNGWNFHFSTQTYYLSVKFILKYKDRNRLKLFVWSLIMYHSFDQVTYIMLYRWFTMHVKNYSISFPFWCGSGLAIVLQREHMAGNTRKDRNLQNITNYLFYSIS